MIARDISGVPAGRLAQASAWAWKKIPLQLIPIDIDRIEQDIGFAWFAIDRTWMHECFLQCVPHAQRP